MFRPYNAYPNFETVFTTLTPLLSFSLETTFLCTKTSSTNGEGQRTEDEALDVEWHEWSLPTKKPSSSDLFEMSGYFNSYGLNHRGSTPLVIRRESNLSAEQRSELKHYLDPNALAPGLSGSAVSGITPLRSSSELRLVGHENREEAEGELKQSRYDLYQSGRGYQSRCRRTRFGGEPSCLRRNNGGDRSHAAKLWQRMEEEKKSSEAVVETNKAKDVSEQAVYRVPAAARRYV